MNVSEVKLMYKSNTAPSDRAKITSSRDANEVLRKFVDLDQIELRESFHVILLNRNNHVLGVLPLSTGSTSGCLVDPKLVAQSAILSNSSAVILAHNHPSGNLNPSQADKHLTNRIKEGLQLFDIQVLDHLILGVNGYLSMADESLM